MMMTVVAGTMEIPWLIVATKPVSKRTKAKEEEVDCESLLLVKKNVWK